MGPGLPLHHGWNHPEDAWCGWYWRWNRIREALQLRCMCGYGASTVLPHHGPLRQRPVLSGRSGRVFGSGVLRDADAPELVWYRSRNVVRACSGFFLTGTVWAKSSMTARPGTSWRGRQSAASR